MTNKTTASGHQLITRQRKGAQGDSAVTYSIVAEPSCIVIGKDGKPKENSIVLTGYIQTGNGTPSELSNTIKSNFLRSGGHVESGQSPLTIDLTSSDFLQDLSSGAYSIECTLYDTDGKTVLKQIDIPITKDGADGSSVQSVDVVYQRSTSNTLAPTSWVTNAPKLPKGYYLWSANKITYKKSDGTTSTETVGAQCIASADNLKTATERYAQITSRTTPPANDSSEWKEGDTSGVAAKDGYYTWTQTKLTWQDGSITYTDPICITGDKGAQGDNASTVVIDLAAIEHKKSKEEIWTFHVRVKDGNAFVRNTEFSCSATAPSGLTKNLVSDVYDREYLTKSYSAAANTEVSGTITVKTTYKGVTHTNYIPVTTVKDGDPGSQGLQGCILRISEWVSGMEYHNDEALTSGTRYLDIAIVTESATSFHAFKCLKTHTSSSSNAPKTGTTTTEWQPLNDLAPIYTPLILAQYALLRLTQTNQLLVMKADGKTVNAGMGGGDYPLWVGASNPTDAAFYVDAGGSLHATSAEIKGFVYPKKNTVDDSNFSSYFNDMKWEDGKLNTTILRNGYIDYKATGNREIILSGLREATKGSFTDAEKQAIRSMVGTIVRIYNSGTGTLLITGDCFSARESKWSVKSNINMLTREADSSFTSFAIASGEFAVIRCMEGLDENNKEVIYWEFTKGTKL